MYGYIYLTTNLINNKKYIGQHRSEKFDLKYFGSGILLKEALSKYGKENFRIELLKECISEDDLNNSEIYYINLFDAVNSDNFYNIANGGDGHTCDPWNKGLKGCYKPTQKQLDALARGRTLPSSEKHKKQLSDRRKGIKVSEETRSKLRENQLGRKYGDETKEKHRQALLGSKNPNFGGISDEHKENIRKSSSNRVHIHKGLVNKNVKRDILESYLLDGWELGYHYKSN